MHTFLPLQELYVAQSSLNNETATQPPTFTDEDLMIRVSPFEKTEAWKVSVPYIDSRTGRRMSRTVNLVDPQIEHSVTVLSTDCFSFTDDADS